MNDSISINKLLEIRDIMDANPMPKIKGILVSAWFIEYCIAEGYATNIDGKWYLDDVAMFTPSQK